MVNGYDFFKQNIGKYQNEYVIIGGTACDLLMDINGVSFRKTKDIDMVLIVENLSKEFGLDFWQFIKDGQYSVDISPETSTPRFYRFKNHKDTSYPTMIELFSKKPINYPKDIQITPIHIDDTISSLSAIILDNDYYNSLIQGKIIVNGLSILNYQTLILFKIKAWQDLSDRKANNEPIDSKHIKKHKNDVFRLIQLYDETYIHINQTQKDIINRFITHIQEDTTLNLKSLELNFLSKKDIITALSNMFHL